MICLEHAKQFKDILKSRQLKATSARLDMLEVFAHQSRPLSIGQLKVKLSEKVDLATLYRNAETLAKIGLLLGVNFGDKKEYYELAKNKHHHHLVCTACGKISDVKNCKVPTIANQALKTAGFAEVNSHRLEFFGLCEQCNN